MHRLHGTGAVLLLSLMIGCGDQSQPPATSQTSDPGENVASDAAPPAATTRAEVPIATPAAEIQSEVGIPATAQYPSRDGGNPVAYKYRVKLDSRCLAEQSDGKRTKIDADSTFTYVWRWRGSEAELQLDSLKVRTTIDGRRMMDSSMSGAHFYLNQGDQLVSETYENANPQLQRVLQDCFRNPLCKMVVDRQGNELSRTVTAGPAAQAVVNTGIITNTRLFHAPFPIGRQRWQAPGEMAAGDGGSARGDVTYETTGRPINDGDEPSNLVEVNVHGTLTAEAASQDSPVKNAVYRLEGTQVYNRRLKEWVSGTLAVGFSFDTLAGGQETSNTGTLRLTMQLVDAQQLPPVRVAAKTDEPALR